MTTRTQTLISGAIAGLALLGLAGIPAIAHNNNEEPRSQVQTPPTEAEMPQMMERCNSMMNRMRMPNRQDMMDRGDREMMDNHNSQPRQEHMMNPTREE